MEVLLMTGTIRPFSNIKHCNVNTRYAEYMENIKRYIMLSNFEAVIFAENSGYEIDSEYFKKLAEENNKKFEYLNVSMDNGVSSTNMSVGDASIIRAALNRSKILTDQGIKCFWKVSGRLWINNINLILAKTRESQKNIFLYAPRYDSIQTWLFKANIHDLKKYFLTDATIDFMKKSCIEYAFKAVYAEHKKKIAVNRFPVYPDAWGVNSSGNQYTSSSGKFYLRNFFLKVGYYTVK